MGDVKEQISLKKELEQCTYSPAAKIDVSIQTDQYVSICVVCVCMCLCVCVCSVSVCVHIFIAFVHFYSVCMYRVNFVFTLHRHTVTHYAFVFINEKARNSWVEQFSDSKKIAEGTYIHTDSYSTHIYTANM